nr:insulin-like growth factor-binding protein complex acid labile subunit [Leptinotarsa decemlineata]
MEDDKIQFMCWRAILTMLVLAMAGSISDGAICPAACKCENDVLKTSCSSASLEFVPIQLNPELHELDLSNNKIVQIHFSFPFYEKLVVLNLSSNKIKTLGNSNFNFQRNLTHLDLSSNQIENLTKDSLKGLKALTNLDLRNNSLEELQAAAFRELHSLSVLRLCGNRLLHLEEGLFRAAKNLKELYLNDNQFLEVPTAALSDTVHLRYLSLSRNFILYVEEGDMPNLPELHTLLLNSNVITEIHPAGLSSLVTLDHLDLSDNNLTAMPTTPLAKLSSLSTLKLSGNFISFIPPVAFRGLFHLKFLRIDRLDTLKQIDVRAFVDNINLEKVNMDYNIGIKKLPTRLFHGNSKVRYISVRFNSLQSLEAIHFPLDQLHELRVGGNPLNCNCSLGWLWQLLQEYRSNSLKLNSTVGLRKDKLPSLDLILDDSDIICDGPEDLTGELLSSSSKHQMDCSVGWMAAVSVSVTVIFILLVIGGVVYWAPKRRSKNNKKDLSLEENIRRGLPPPNIHRKTDVYEAAPVEKYILPPPMM